MRRNTIAAPAGPRWPTATGFAVLLPEQTRANNAQNCFNCSALTTCAATRASPLSIRQMIGHLVADHGVSARRVHVTGLSAGGAMTAVMLATYPELFAAGAIIAGLPYGGATGVPAALEAMFKGRHHSAAEWAGLVREAAPTPPDWPSVQIWHGTADSTVNPANADELARQWAAAARRGGPPARWKIR